MKRKEKEALHAMTVEELERKLKDIETKLYDSGKRAMTTREKNVHTMLSLRKQKAILLTILEENNHMREIQAK